MTGRLTRELLLHCMYALCMRVEEQKNWLRQAYRLLRFSSIPVTAISWRTRVVATSTTLAFIAMSILTVIAG